MNITIEARHMEITDAIRQYAESKVQKLPKYYDNIQSIEVIMELDGGKPSVEIIVQGGRKNTFVARLREDDLYAGIDGCVDKIAEQLRRHKDKVRDRQGTPHSELP